MESSPTSRYFAARSREQNTPTHAVDASTVTAEPQWTTAACGAAVVAPADAPSAPYGNPREPFVATSLESPCITCTEHVGVPAPDAVA